jgi:hypothetical protein
MAECTFCKAETQLYENGEPVCIACDEKRLRKPADIRTLLVNAIADATARVSAANQVFSSVMSEIPTGFPHPDGAQRIHNASQELDDARKEMMKAHTRLNDYISRGIVPEDVKRSG